MFPIKLAVVAGARPNFMKIAPLMKALAGDPDFNTVLTISRSAPARTPNRPPRS
jgi:UDP-N-acetylglucosamine 2-epimerase